MRAVAVAATLTLAPALADAQSLSAGAAVGHARLNRIGGAATGVLSGIGLGLEGRIGIGIVELAARYQQTDITSDDGVARLDHVDGELFLVARPARWIAVEAGPHARSFVSANSTERWVFWEARIRTTVTLLGPLRATLAGWRVLAATEDGSPPLRAAYGVDGGLILPISRPALYFQLRYRTERTSFDGPTRRDTLEQVLVVVALGSP